MKIKLNDQIGFDLDKLIQSRAIIVANSGGGKSQTIRRVAEEAVGKVQILLIDPEGEFSSLREKFDFILAGKNADVPVEVRSASLLATKLLEINKSAVIDLYELSKQDRQRFVKLFINALVDAPKELYHPVLVILDEAHDYAPEGKPSEATQAVEDLSSKGRKRGYCLIPATQRISKLSKNVSAECNNKLIGRASQDLDMKRAGDELGFAKDELVHLRQLKPGEFFAFGPAISDEVIKLTIGKVQTAHAKVGYKNVGKVPPASEAIKKILGELKDLPQEAEKEAKTVAELKKENADLKRKLKADEHHFTVKETYIPDQKIIDEAVKKMERQKDEELFQWQTKWQTQVENWFNIIIGIGESMKEVRKKKIDPPQNKLFDMPIKVNPKLKKGEWFLTTDVKPDTPARVLPKVKEEFGYTGWPEKDITESKSIGKGEREILNAIAQYPDGITTEHIAVLIGYKTTSRRTYLQRLGAKKFIDIDVNGNIYATEDGIRELGDSFKPLPTGQELQNHVMATLPDGEKRILAVLLGGYPEFVNKEEIMNSTGYKLTSVRTYLQRLGARKLIETGKNDYRASDKLFS